jgi:O-antigen/teichoic acid export membrane protein
VPGNLLFQRFTQFAGVSTLRRNIGLTLARQLLAACAQLLLVVLIARELGPEGNGHYAIAILIPTMLANFLNLGIGPATVYYLSRNDCDIHQAIAGNLRLAIIISSIGVVCTLPVLCFWSHEIFPGVSQKLLYLGLASFPLTLLLAYLNTILQGLEDFKAFNLTILLPPYMNLIGVVIALYWLQLGVPGAVVAYLTGQLVGLVIVFRLLGQKRTSNPVAREAPPIYEYASRTLGYGWKAHLSNILAFVNYRADIFLVNFFLTPAATGIYVIAVQIAEKLWILSQAASTVLFPRLSSMYQNPKARLALTNKGFWVVSAITAAASIALAVSLWWLIRPVFGEEYVEALPAFLWLLPGIIAGSGSRIYANCIAAAGRPEWNMYSAVAVVIINVLGNIILVPEYGIVGAAWATSVAYCSNAGIKAWLIRKTWAKQ